MKILFTPMASSSLAHMTRLFAIADEMKEYGHEVLFTSSDERKSFIESSGYKVFEKTYPPINFNDPKDQSLNYIKDNRDHFVKWFDSEIKAAEYYKPNVIITSPGFLGGHTTLKTKIPTVAILNAPYLSESVGILGLSKSQNTLRDKTFRKILKPIFEKKFMRLYVNEVLDIYKELEIDFVAKSRKEIHSSLDVIIPSIYEIEPVDSFDKYYYSGPIYWYGFEKKYDIDENIVLNFKNKRKLIYLSFGGSIFNMKFYQDIFDGISKLPYAFIVSTGPNIDITTLRYNPKNTLVYNFLPGLKVCRMVDLVVNTGSHGTIMQALKYAKPLVCIPCNIDQSFFAYRLEELKVGININKVNLLNFSKRESYYKLDHDISGKMDNAIKRILKDSTYSLNAKKISDSIKKKGESLENIRKYIEQKYGN